MEFNLLMRVTKQPAESDMISQGAVWPHWTTTLGTTLLWAKQMKSLESDETSTSSQLKIIVIYMWEITCSLHNNFQLSEIVSGVWEMRNFKKFDCLVFCSIIATRPSDKSTVTATRPVWLCHSSGTIGRWFWRPLFSDSSLPAAHMTEPVTHMCWSEQISPLVHSSQASWQPFNLSHCIEMHNTHLLGRVG